MALTSMTFNEMFSADVRRLGKISKLQDGFIAVARVVEETCPSSPSRGEVMELLHAAALKSIEIVKE